MDSSRGVVDVVVEPEYRGILAFDIDAFGNPRRTDPIRLRLHQFLVALLVDLLTEADIRDGAYAVGDTGDGLIVSVSATVPLSRLLDPLIPSLVGRLAAFNGDAGEPARVRLRVAVHAGGVLSDPAPMHGETVIHACRLLDCAAVRACLRATDQPVAVIVSHAVYDSVVKHGYRSIDPRTWHPVIADVKETRVPAWVHVPNDVDAPRRAGAVVDHGSTGRPPATTAPREPVWGQSGIDSAPTARRLDGDCHEAAYQLDAASLFEIVDVLLQIDVMADERARQQVVDLLPRTVATAIRRHPVPRIDVLAIVRTCANYPGALRALFHLVHGFEGDSIPIRRLDAALSQIPCPNLSSESVP